MKAVPRFVQQRGDVLGNAGRVHEHERPAPGVQRVAIAARRLARPRLQVEQSLGYHRAELSTERRVDCREDLRGDVLQLADILVRYR